MPPRTQDDTCPKFSLICHLTAAGQGRLGESKTIEADFQRAIPEIKGNPRSDFVRNEEILLEPYNPLMPINEQSCLAQENHLIDTRSSHVSFGG